MAVFAIPNPKKSTIVDYSIEKIKLSLLNLNLANNKYKFTKSNEIFNQYTFEAVEFLSLGVFIDINLNSISENKTEITVEVRRKVGSFNQSYEITKANEHIDKVYSAIATLTSKSAEEIEILKNSNNLSKSLSNKKDERPFYKKKRFIIPAVVISTLVILISQTDTDSTTTSKTNIEQTNETPEPTIDLKTKLENNIKSIDGGDDFTKNEMTTATDFQISIAIYKAYAIMINEGKQSKEKEIIDLTNELQNKVVQSQKKNFPKIRNAYYKMLKNTLWEHDVDVYLSGNGNTIIKFTGGYFAANKNIKETQETLHEMLSLLRFKQTQYRWYSGQDEFTYYTIESPNDSEIIE